MHHILISAYLVVDFSEPLREGAQPNMFIYSAILTSQTQTLTA
jgi:hypothetical protein